MSCPDLKLNVVHLATGVCHHLKCPGDDRYQVGLMEGSHVYGLSIEGHNGCPMLGMRDAIQELLRSSPILQELDTLFTCKN